MKDKEEKDNIQKLVVQANDLANFTLKFSGTADLYEFARSAFNHYLDPEYELNIKNAIILAYNRGRESK